MKQNTWKGHRIDYHRFMYGDYVERFTGHTDDRQLFINTYNTVLSALESLEDEPNSLVKVAVNAQINKEYELMDRILAWFEPGGHRV
jgi:hypothetical protein